MAFIHEELSDASRCIRLLEVLAGKDDEDLHCMLMHHDFIVSEIKTLPKYAAVSYTWGPPQPLRSIFVNNKPLLVRENI
jgi:hypothetical protein